MCREWPVTSRKLTEGLKRSTTCLRQMGIDVEFGDHGRRGVAITIRRLGGIAPVAPEQPAVEAAVGSATVEPVILGVVNSVAPADGGTTDAKEAKEAFDEIAFLTRIRAMKNR